MCLLLYVCLFDDLVKYNALKNHFPSLFVNTLQILYFCKSLNEIDSTLNSSNYKIKIMAFDIDMIKNVYSQMVERVDKAREITGKPLTLSEKILYSHLWDGNASKAFCKR